MTELSQKYNSVVAAAQNAGIQNLQVSEQEGKLYIKGETSQNSAKEAVWDALALLDPNFTSSDINIDVEVNQNSGNQLVVSTEDSSLNVRSTPGTDGDIVGKAERGSTVTLVEQYSSEWYKIRTADGVEGYAFSRYLK